MKEREKETIVREVKSGGRGDVIVPFLVYYVVYLCAAVILTQIVTLIRIKSDGPVQTFLTQQEATVGAVLGGVAMLFGIVPLLPAFLRELEGGGRKNIWRKTVVTILLALTSSIAVNILFSQLHLLEKSETYAEVSGNQYSVWFPVGLFLYGILTPLAEEIVFRGVIYNRMKRHFTIKQAVILSSLLFGVYHGNLIQGLYGFFLGCLIAYTYETFGLFFFAVLFHAAANTAIYTITGSESLYWFIMRPFFGIACVIITGAVLLRMKKTL